MRKQPIAEMLRREARAILKMVPWLVAALLMTALIWRTDLAAIAGIYQSPSGVFQSPPEETATPVPPTDAPTAEPTVPRITATPTEEVAATPTTEPTSVPAATAPPTITPVPSATLFPTLTSTPSATALPTLTTVPLATQSVDQGEPTPDDPRYSEGDSNLRFDLGMLFDSVALGLTYMWLCCGVLVLFGIPVVFIILWVASKRQAQAGAAETAAPEQPQAGEAADSAQPPVSSEQPESDS
jgi:hypothetical protein